MSRDLRVLIVEDSEDDALLLVRELERGGYEPAWRRVQTAAELEQALDEKTWDLILSDYRMPGFTGAEALAMVRGRGLDTPFIVVSGTAGEETAVEMMRDGADDYFLKGTLRLLPGAVARELREAAVRRARREAEERLRLLTRALEASANAVVLTDRDGQIQWVNPAFTYLTGYEAEEAVGRNPRFLKSGQQSDSFYKEMWDTILAGKVWHGEMLNKRKGGTLYTEEMTITPVTSEGGEVTHFIAIKQDISERKEMERALQQSEKSYRQLFENAPEAIYIQERDGSFIDVNRGACEMYGREKEFFLGKTPADLAAPGMNDLERIAALVEDTFENGTTHAFEFWGVRSDGSPFPKEVRVAPGIYYGRRVVIAYSRDITQAKAAEKALRESEERYRDLVENSHELICTHTLDGTLLSANRALGAALGVAPEAVAGMRLHDIVDPAYRDEVDGYLAGIAREGWAKGVMQVRTRAGETRLWEFSNSLRTEGVAEPVVRGLARDVTEERRARRELEESEERYRDLVENSLDIIATHTLDGAVLTLNRTAETALGLAREAIAGTNLREFVHPRFRDEVAAYLDTVAERGEASGIMRIQRPGRDEQLWEYRSSVRSEDVDEPVVRSVLRDVTEERRARRELEESEERYRDLVEHSHELICTHSLDGTLLSANRAAEAAVGAAPGAAVGMRLHDIVDPAYIDGLEEYLVEVAREGRAKGVMRVRTTAGETRLWEYSNSVRTEGVAEPVVRGLARDVTEEWRARRELEESEERYRDLVEKAGVAILVDDEEGRFIYFNRRFAELFGYPEDEIREMSIERLVYPDDRERVMSMHRLHLAGEGPWSYRSRAVSRDGRTLHLSVDVTPLVKDGRIVGTRSYLRDITEEEHLQEQLLQAQKMESVGRLAGGVAHDFNNILQAILMHADVALESSESGLAPEPHVREIRAAADRAAALTRQLLAFSRREEMNPRRLDLNELVEGELKMLRRVIGEDVEIMFHPGAGALRVEADAGQLEQVVMNLVVNARDAMPRGGQLTISTGAVAGDGGPPRVRLTVADSGCGMDEATRQRIFEPFFTTKERERGTGLGLATVYGVVRRHGGTIDVESEPGKGAAFTVLLPAAAGALVETAAAAERPEVRGGAETVLVAEDDPAVREVVVGILEGAGYTVLVAEDGEEAVTLFAERPDDVAMVLLDAIMPRKDGIEALEEIRALRPGVPALFSSGYSGTALGSTHTLPEDVGIIEKPYTVSDLLVRVRQVLDGKSPGAQS